MLGVLSVVVGLMFPLFLGLSNFFDFLDVFSFFSASIRRVRTRVLRTFHDGAGFFFSRRRLTLPFRLFLRAIQFRAGCVLWLRTAYIILAPRPLQGTVLSSSVPAISSNSASTALLPTCVCRSRTASDESTSTPRATGAVGNGYRSHKQHYQYRVEHTGPMAKPPRPAMVSMWFPGHF